MEQSPAPSGARPNISLRQLQEGDGKVGKSSFLRQDDNSEEFLAALESHAREVLRAVSPHMRADALNQLAENCLTQKKASYFLEALLEDASRKQAGAPAQRFETRMLLLALTSPVSLDAGTELSRFHSQFVSSSRERQIEMLSHQLGAENLAFGMLAGTILHGLLEMFLPRHEPEPGRPADRPTAYQIGHFLADKFISVATNTQILEHIEALLYSLREEKKLPANLNEQQRFGYRLGFYLCRLGSGMQKVAQYGDSLPQTPEEWCPGLKPSKSDAGHLFRWQVWRQIEERREHIERHLIRLGRRRGSGAYQTTYDAEFERSFRERIIAAHPDRHKHDLDLVLKLLKPGAESRASDTLDLAHALCDQATMEKPEAGASIEPLRKLLRQARRMVGPETDLRSSIPQELSLNNMYSAMRIFVNGSEYIIRATAVFAADKDFSIAEAASGDSLNTMLSENNPFATECALAMGTCQAAIKGSGRRADHDCHGDNFSCLGNRIYHYDYNGHDLTDPEPKSRRIFADVLFNTIANCLRNKYGFLSSLKHTMMRMEQSGLPSGKIEKIDFEFVESTQRCLISWGDWVKASGLGASKVKNIKSLAAAVTASGLLDSEIWKTLLKRTASALYVEVAERVALLPRNYAIFKAETFHRDKYYPYNPNANLKSRSNKVVSDGERPSDGSLQRPVNVRLVNLQSRSMLNRVVFGLLSRVF